MCCCTGGDEPQLSIALGLELTPTQRARAAQNKVSRDGLAQGRQQLEKVLGLWQRRKSLEMDLILTQ